MVRTIRWSMAAAFLAGAGMLGAQQVAAPAPAMTEASARFSPGATNTHAAPDARSYVVEQPAGVRRAEPAKVKPAPAPRPAETRRNEAMMIVGGAALIVGAIIGDTPGQLIMVGGAGLGLYGLYQYLQ